MELNKMKACWLTKEKQNVFKKNKMSKNVADTVFNFKPFWYVLN